MQHGESTSGNLSLISSAARNGLFRCSGIKMKAAAILGKISAQNKTNSLCFRRGKYVIKYTRKKGS